MLGDDPTEQLGDTEAQEVPETQRHRSVSGGRGLEDVSLLCLIAWAVLEGVATKTTFPGML